MARSDGEGFELAPVPIGGAGRGPGGRRRFGGRLGIAAVLVMAVAIPLVAIASPRKDGPPTDDRAALLTGPPSARIGPTARPTTRPTPTPTPLPSLVLRDGRRPSAPIAIDIGGLSLLDPGTGEIGPRVSVHLDSDAVFRATGGGYWCVCFAHVSGPSTDDLAVEVRQFDRRLVETGRFPITAFASRSPASTQDFGVRIDLVRSPDGSIAFLAAGERDGDQWKVSLAAIDLARGVLVARVDVADVTSPLPAEPRSSPRAAVETYFIGPQLRVSPDGRSLLLSMSVDSYDSTANTSESTSSAWIVDVAPGEAQTMIGAIHPLPGDLASRLTQCGGIAWLSNTELVTTCLEPSTDTREPTFVAQVLDRGGRPTATARLEMGGEPFYELPIIDRANRLVYAWDPLGHVLRRVDLDDGRSDILTVDAEPSSPTGPPAERRPPAWATMTSDLTRFTDRHLVAGPGMSRLYLLDMIAGASSGDGWPMGVSGIWAVDSATFEVVDTWRPAASYTSIVVSADGRWLSGIGQVGVDVDGTPTGWQSSLTIHDTSDGGIAIQRGRLGDRPVLILP